MDRCDVCRRESFLVEKDFIFLCEDCKKKYTDKKLLRIIGSLQTKLSKKVMKERERIKKIVERKIDVIIAQRSKLKRKRSRLPSLFEELKDNLFFLIDNPDYVRVGKKGEAQ